ncbi:uncharacterized protein A4U43_C06F14200 [Asparagus officinalis]|uniref:SP-RING-type domain-containing protein n=1 Tax=Asparagus officinalis TaxID=4686 RepID=A0A5P1ELU1_ASPOF|nr:E4 SUMO-protein ligase PIAL2-like isoform X2 [Asparagus officinalis]ONK66978.1 uncharacterized protein A4U43_C06F14200 [Asparagus officinalis]
MANACSAPAAPLSSTPLKFSSLLEANSYRLKAIVERLTYIMNARSGSIRFDSAEFFNLFVALARGVDYALTLNDAPTVANRLPSLIKKAYERKHEKSLQPAILMLMISVKNACRNGWFTSAVTDELLAMANELSSSFCMALNFNPGASNSLDVISVVVSRFYPQYKMGSLIFSLEAKPGYEILMSDFQIARNLPSEQKITLLVVCADNLETSSCLISPPQASFLVNGKGVQRRNNVSLDSGPQFPTDLSKMLKFGTNIIQAIGHFTGTYLIALAFMSRIVLSSTPILKDYVPPVIAAVSTDSEIIEGASRITLNCPISFRRIKTPVKGHLCKHHQCFDYDNFLEMNSRKPVWRCPCCNQSVSFMDLCIDQNMVKILKEVGEDVIDVVISADGSWKLAQHNGNKDQMHKENLPGHRDCDMELVSSRSANIETVDVDLTMGEDDQCENHAREMQETKPFEDIHHLLSHYLFANTASSGSLPPATQDVSAVGTSEAALSAVQVNPVMTDAVSPAHGEPPASLQDSQPNFSLQQMSEDRQLAENMQLQPHFGYSTINRVNRTPVAVQALPVQLQPSNSFKRMRINGPSFATLDTGDPSSPTHQTSTLVTATSDGSNTASHDAEIRHLLISHLSLTQGKDQQTSQQIQSLRMQHGVSQPAPNPLSTRTASSLHRVGAYRDSPVSTSSDQYSNRNLSNLRSLIMSNGFGSNPTLPLGAARELARKIAQQKLHPGASNPQASRVGASSTTQAGNQSLGIIADRPRDNDWRPTGKMRGSLTGSAYSAALNKYATPMGQGNKDPGSEPGGPNT